MRRYLQKLFYPNKIAVIGASDRPGTVGYLLIKNLVESDFQGQIYPVNPRHRSVAGKKSYSNVEEITAEIDLAIVATPAPTVPTIITQCGQKNVEAIVIISAGFRESGAIGDELRKKILQNASPFPMRILGPHCLGFINTSIGLNASFAQHRAIRGNVAFISQSGALSLSILDWSVSQNVGFSHVVSTGSMLDIGFHDLIDFFGSDPATSCILIYMESLRNPRAFISAARSVARSKPIIVLKAGKSLESAKATFSHTGALAGNDEVFSAAFRRAGIIRVDSIAQLFHCAQALAMGIKPQGNRLAVVTNAGSPRILAVDYLVQQGGEFPELADEVRAKLNPILSFSWSHRKPLDVLEDATAQQYADALDACLREPQVDGVLVILISQNKELPVEVAREIAKVNRQGKPVLACWMGEKTVHDGRRLLEKHQIPHYRFPERAVDVFLKLYSYNKNLELLYAFTPAIPSDFNPKQAKARNLIHAHLQKERKVLNDRESKEILSCYGIPVNMGIAVVSEETAISAADRVGYPVALKMLIVGVSHKTEVGGVHLDLKSPEEVRRAYQAIVRSSFYKKTDEASRGLTIEPMAIKRNELLIGAAYDQDFGPVISFGMGGVSVEVFRDVSFELPPLNMALAERLINQTKISRLLTSYRNMPGIDLNSLQFNLIKFSYLLMDFPQIVEIDINPYAVDEEGGLIIDATMVLDASFEADEHNPYRHLAISPYPSQYEKKVKIKDDREVLLRAIRPEDEPLEAELFERLSRDTIYFRFFGFIPSFDEQSFRRFTHIDYDREIAIVAIVEIEGKERMIGVVRMIADPWNESAEYAIVIADAWQGLGLGAIMTGFILEIARSKGLSRIEADVMSSNQAMINLFLKTGFIFDKSDPQEWHATLELR